MMSNARAGKQSLSYSDAVPTRKRETLTSSIRLFAEDTSKDMQKSRPIKRSKVVYELGIRRIMRVKIGADGQADKFLCTYVRSTYKAVNAVSSAHGGPYWSVSKNKTLTYSTMALIGPFLPLLGDGKALEKMHSTPVRVCFIRVYVQNQRRSVRCS